MPIDELVKGLAEFKIPENLPAVEVDTKLFKSDIEFLGNTDRKNPAKLTEGIEMHLAKEGKPGSAEYIRLFSKSALLDKQMKMVETGSWDSEKLKGAGLPVLVDIKDGNAELTEDARYELMGSINSLTSRTDDHVRRTIDVASAHYAEVWTHQDTWKETFEKLSGIDPESDEIPLQLNQSEIDGLQQTMQLKFATNAEANDHIRRDLQQMMRVRPDIVGLGATNSNNEYLKELANEVSEGKTARIRDLHEIMVGRGEMEELQIYPGFADAIEQSIREF